MATLAACWLPGTAQADRHHFQLPAGREIQFSLPGTNGYRISVYADYAGRVTVIAAGHGTHTEYSVRLHHPIDRSFRAQLGAFGRIAIRFRPRGRRRRLPRYSVCDGPAPSLQPGAVTGRIDFAADGGFTSVDAGRADAGIESWAKQRCRYLEPGRGHQRQRVAAILFAAADEAPPYADLEVRRFANWARPAQRRVSFVVYASDSRGKVRIFRTASASAAVSSFQTPQPKSYPEHVILSPPPPFSGTASFGRTPESNFAWEGDLAVQFPGVAPVSLTGPQWYAQYCALKGCASQEAEPKGAGEPEL